RHRRTGPDDDEVAVRVSGNVWLALLALRVRVHDELAADRRAVCVQAPADDADVVAVLVEALPHDDEAVAGPRDVRIRLKVRRVHVDLELLSRRSVRREAASEH